MSPEKKKGFPLLDKLQDLVNGFKGLLMLLAALGLGGSGGLLMADAGAPAARVDSLAAEVDTLKAGFGKMRQNQLEMYSAQIEADTALKAILEDRAANRRKAADARAETEKLFNEITGGIP